MNPCQIRQLFQRFALGVVISMSLQACRQQPSLTQTQAVAKTGGAEVAAQVAAEVASVTRFRDLFHQIARARGYSDQDIQQQIFLPPQALLTPSAAALAATSAQATNDALVEQARHFLPSEVYKHGVATPFGAPIDIERIMAEKGPVTFVVLPGLMEEVLGKAPFQSVLDAGGAFKDRYSASIASLVDSSYDLGEMRDVPTTIGTRVHLASIDDAAGQPRIQIIEMGANFGSLESLDTVASSAAAVIRRLNTVFTRIPLDACPRLYLIGYSRGVSEALEVAATVQRDAAKYPFAKNLAGIVSMGGVLYGTELVDSGLQPGGSLQRFFTTLDNGLSEARNAARYTDAASSRAALTTLLGKARQQAAAGLQASGAAVRFDDPAIDPDFVKDNLEKIAYIFFKDGWDFGRNFQRVQLMSGALQRAVNELGTQGRLAWWRDHTLPADLQFFAINASMPEAPEVLADSPLEGNPNYGSGMLDFKYFLRGNTDQLQGLTGVALNDSQVIETKARLWPSLLQKFNPQQPQIATYYLGMTGTHHWGLGLPVIMRQVGGVTNPFPRTIMLEAMAAFVSAPRG